MAEVSRVTSTDTGAVVTCNTLIVMPGTVSSAAQPALIVRSRVPRSAIAATIGQSLGRIVPYALGAGAVFTGQPFARYPEFGPGEITLEVGMPLAAPVIRTVVGVGRPRSSREF